MSFRGGYSGGGRGRKRPRGTTPILRLMQELIEDDEDEAGRGPRFSPAQSFISQTKKSIVYFCDPKGNKTASDAVDHLSQQLCNPLGNTEEAISGLSEAILASVTELPLRVSFLATSVMIAFSKGSEIAGKVLERLPALCQESLDSGDLMMLSLRVRFAIICSNLYEQNLGVEYLKETLQLARSISSPATKSELIFAVLVNLPYVVISCEPDAVRDEISGLLDQCFALAPQVDCSVLSPWLAPEAPIPAFESNLKILLEDLRNLPAGYDFPQMEKPWAPHRELISASRKLASPNITSPSGFFLRGPLYSSCNPFFRIFFDQNVQSTPDVTDVTSIVLRAHCIENMCALEMNRETSARLLTDLDMFFPYGTFALRGIPIGELDSIEEGASTWKLEDIFIESIFAELSRLPTPNFYPLYYHSLITEACQIAPKIIAPTIGRAIRTFFNFSEKLEAEVLFRFIDWFSHHLSNFSFNWKWNEWEEALELPEDHPKMVVIKNVIQKEVRLSYQNRIKNTLPEAFHRLLTEEAPSGKYRYDEGEQSFSESASKLMEVLRQEESPENVAETVNDLEVAPTDKVQMVITCVANLGGRIMSSCQKALEAYQEILKSLCRVSQETQFQTMDAIRDYWIEIPLNCYTVICSMAKLEIVSRQAVVEWVLQERNYPLLCGSFGLDIVHCMIELNMKQSQQAATAQEIEADASLDDKTMEVLDEEKKNIIYSVLSQSTEVPDGTQPFKAHWISGMVKSVARRHASEIAHWNANGDIEMSDAIRAIVAKLAAL